MAWRPPTGGFGGRSSRSPPIRLRRRQAWASRPLADWAKALDEFDAYRFARLTAWLRQREPDDTVNFSILVYHLTDADVIRDLEGPSPTPDSLGKAIQ